MKICYDHCSKTKLNILIVKCFAINLYCFKILSHHFLVQSSSLKQLKQQWRHFLFSCSFSLCPLHQKSQNESLSRRSTVTTRLTGVSRSRIFKFLTSFFYKCWVSLGEHLLDHLLWSIFQSSMHKQYKLHFFMIQSVLLSMWFDLV